MKDNYNKKIKLVCSTCGADDLFETDPQTGVITCQRCNRKYYGGYDELVGLNQKRIEDEILLTVEEVEIDLEKDIIKMFKKHGLNIK